MREGAPAAWRPDDRPDWDAIAGARPKHRSRRVLSRVVRLAWRATAVTGAVGLIASFAGERTARMQGEVLALAFTPEVGAGPASGSGPELIEAGRFGDRAATFARIGAGSAGGLYLEAVRLAALSGGLGVTRAGTPVPVDTALGPAEWLSATLEDAGGGQRACTAFRHGGREAGGSPLVGWICAGAAACAGADLPEPAQAVLAALACPPTRQLGGNPDPPRASFPQTRRDRAGAVRSGGRT